MEGKRMKKKILYMLLALGLLIACGGCVNSSKKEKPKKTKKLKRYTRINKSQPILKKH